ncbi:MAG: carboxypeptidase-like regulatory domain-containing protein [Bacteroidales bacterium]|nr:carboxypeptidase-like regulatory domain-containing protein [Bacteroidales bacterium]MDT8430573.1 carboxypeptidase-like regulatory domain-containing protein [Bacteroidales bacterium]
MADLKAQVTLSGVVKDAEFQSGIPGAIVTEGYTENKTRTDATGRFSLRVPTHTNLTLVITRSGFETKELPVITANKSINIGVIAIQSDELNLVEIYKLADRAVWRDPVTWTGQDGNKLSILQGMLQPSAHLYHIPGMYATEKGSRYGETKLNIRGFGQQHISIMLNGVPVNDPGRRTYSWSGRDGILENVSTFQLQKGTSREQHYSPYGGGTMNYITGSARQQAGGNAGFEYGAGNYMHTTVTLHTGLLNDKFALSMSGSRKTSEGIINGAWTDVWAYYFTMTYAASNKHRFEIYAMGAPQRHGQAIHMQHVAAYSHNFAAELGVPQEILEAIPRSGIGRYYNQGVNQVDPDYPGQQYWNGKVHERYAPAFLNENEHYSHAPIAQINWYADWSETISQQTTFYYSGLNEGSSGVSGSVNLDYSGPSAFIDYNSTIAENQAKSTSEGILNNSVREQISAGAVSRLNFQFSEQFNSSLGLDLSSSGIQRYQEVRDLLGGNYFIFSGNEFDDPSDEEKPLGGIIGYHHTDQIHRISISGDVEYTGKKLNAFASGAFSMANYSSTNHLRRDIDSPGQKYQTVPDVAPGFQVKSGISYRLLDDLLLYGNYSLISREPDSRLFLNSPWESVAGNPTNVSMKGWDGGIRYAFFPENGFAISVYDYLLINSSLSQEFSDQLNNVYLLHISNISQHHRGIELEAGFQPVRFFGIEANASLGSWIYAEDASGTLVNIPSGNETGIDYTFRTRDLRTGDAPQLQLGAVLSVYPLKHSYIRAGFRYYGQHYSTWNPIVDLTSESQILWEIPAYYIIDLHGGFTLMAGTTYRIAFKGHIFNLLDELYISDAVNNGSLQTLPEAEVNEYANSAASASVFIGLPRTYSIGINVLF